MPIDPFEDDLDGRGRHAAGGVIDILSRLSDNAHRMPPARLQTVLARQWGTDWRECLRRFDPTPIAAASIGQVHGATTFDGEDLATKVQYPGVAKSIDADVDKLTTLLRVSDVLPASSTSRNCCMKPSCNATRTLNIGARARR